MICLFLVHLYLEGLAYTTINNEVSALVLYAKLNRQCVDLRGDFGIKITLQALRRILGDTPLAKEELYPKELVSMSRYVNLTEFQQESVWLGILILYRSMLRKSHLFVGDFNENLLLRKDVVFTDWGLVININHSKTIQYRQRLVQVPICNDSGPLGVVSRLKNYCQRYPMESTAPILSRKMNGIVEVVRYTSALAFLKKWAIQAGVSKNLGMHSLRRGAATVMALAGMPLEDIKNRGDWQSVTALKYLAYPMPQKITIDQKVFSFISTIL